MKITRYIHRPNLTELGMGNTNETYMLIGGGIDLSSVFPVGVDTKVVDQTNGKSYILKSKAGNEFRVNQLGQLYRDYNVRPGDELTFTCIDNGSKNVFFSVEHCNRVVLYTTASGSEIANLDRLNEYRVAGDKYYIHTNVGGLSIRFLESKKKRQDSPNETEFYSATLNNIGIEKGTLYINLGSKCTISTLQKSEISIHEIEDVTSESDNAIDTSVYSEYINLLREHYNLVLTGAPGTGKTFLAKQIAATMIGNCAWNQLSDEQMKHVHFIQFHPSYDYTDFVEGLRPASNGDFIRTDGDFKAFCKVAINDPEIDYPAPYVFIIDEINRGEISKIFGELFYSIEADYRGDETLVRTQYNNMVAENDTFYKGFYVPKNVYIIGTMNDIDRGVEAMDFAIRRRFAWREVTAEDSAINMGISGLALHKMRALNNALKECNLSEAFYIGGAYFRKIKNNDFDALWKYHLKGIVSEYFRGEPNADESILAVEKAYNEAQIIIEAPAQQTEENTDEADE